MKEIPLADKAVTTIRIIPVLLFMVILGVGCKSLPYPVERTVTPEWFQLEEGLYWFSFRDVENPLAIYVLRVDLSLGIWEPVFTSPGDSSGWEMAGIRTSRFLQDEGCTAAVNGSPFEPYRYFFPGRGQNLSGLYLWQGRLISSAIDELDAFVIGTDGIPVIKSQEEYPFPAEYILGGFQRILKDGEFLSGSSEKEPRTALGISQDNRYLYMFVADGRRHNFSLGLTIDETALWLKRLGAWNAINMDGGGSSTMVLADDEGGALLVNRPVNRRGVGERIVASHFGIKRIRM